VRKKVTEKGGPHENAGCKLADDARKPEPLHALRAQPRYGEEHAELEDEEDDRVTCKRLENRVHA
jgi:hypothetical protein